MFSRFFTSRRSTAAKNDELEVTTSDEEEEDDDDNKQQANNKTSNNKLVANGNKQTTNAVAAAGDKVKKVKSKNNSEVDDSLDERSLTNDESLAGDDDDVDQNVDLSDFSADDSDDDDDDDDDDNAAKQRNKKKKSNTNKLKDNNDNPLLPEEMCELPTFLNSDNCDKKLVERTRSLLRVRYAKRPQNFVKSDYELMLEDDWTVSRFLLRCRNEPKRAAKLMELCGKFRREFRMGSSQPSDFPIEFHKAGGLFRYAPDRVGNQTLYMRVKMHLRNRELCKIMKEFILCALEECDKANNGRGTAIIFDLTGCGLQNVDPSFLFWLVYSFRTYCPKGLSYIIVYNLPWILNATAKLALSWLSSTNRKRMRFVSGDAIQDFIAPENLPDFMGGTCKLNYRRVPRDSQPAVETAEQYNMTREQSKKILDNYIKFLKNVEPDVSFEATDADYEMHL